MFGRGCIGYGERLVLFCALAMAVLSGRLFGQDYELWSTIDGGGATFSTGGGYELGGTIGQPDVGILAAGDYFLVGGFWGLSLIVDSDLEFLRGDANGDGVINPLVEAIFLLAFGFQNGPPPPCLEAAETDGDGVLNALVEAIYILAFGFQNGPPPPPPYPDCGPDPDPEGSLGCESYPVCP